MKRYSQKHGLSTLSELNVTPLLDLAFVLLIIFMITTPLVENSVDLVVPSSGVSSSPVEPSKVQTVEVDRNNEWKLNGDVVTPAELESRLALLKQQNPELSVVVRPHKELEIQKFIGVMDVLKRLKIAKVGVVTRKEDSTP